MCFLLNVCPLNFMLYYISDYYYCYLFCVTDYIITRWHCYDRINFALGCVKSSIYLFILLRFQFLLTIDISCIVRK